MKNLDVLSCSVRPKAGCQSIYKADDRYRLLFTTPGIGRCKTGIKTVGHHPLCVYHFCLPDVIAHDEISQPGNEAN